MRRLAAMFVLALVLAACGDGGAATTSVEEATPAGEETTASAAEETPDVEETSEVEVTTTAGLEIVATTSILGDLVSSVVQDDATVEVLLPIGADPHDFAPSAAQAGALRDADLVVANGLDLEEGLVSLLEGAAQDGVVVFEATDHVDLIPFDGDHGHSHGDDDEHGHDDDDEHGHDDDDEHGHDDDDEHGHDDDEHGHGDDDEHGHDDDDEHGHDDDEHGHGDDDEHGHDDDDEHGHDEDDEHGHDDDHGHDHGDEDPHVWFDPVQMASVVEALGVELTSLDDSIDWEARAAAVSDELIELDAELREILDVVPDENRILVTNHDALGYFADAYDFEIAATIIPGGTTLSEPSAADLQDVIDIVADTGVSAIFAETTAGAGLADVVADEVGSEVEVIELYTESLSAPDGPAATYVDMMRTNATRIAEGLAG